MDGLAGIGVDKQAGTKQIHISLSSEWVEMIEQNGQAPTAAIIHALASEMRGKITPLRARDQARTAVEISIARIEIAQMQEQERQEILGALAAARGALLKMYVG